MTAIGPPLRVLLVDDSPDDRALVRRAVLRQMPGTEFVEPLDAQDLQRALDDLRCDAAITDYRIGWTDGLKVLGAIKAGHPDLPVIMFTMTGNEEVCARGMKAGLHDYLLKHHDQYARLAQVLWQSIVQARQAAELARHRAELERGRSELAALLERESAAREEAEQARAVAQRANRMKDEFLATLSHELRTPLTALLGWAELLLRKDDDAAMRRQGLEAIRRNARAQSRLIEDLLDMSRIVSGNLRLEVETVDVVQAVRAALESVTPAAAQAGIVLESALDPDAGRLDADPARVQQIVANLLSNAVKFTPQGGRVRLTTRRAGDQVEIRVSDTGRGIDPAFLPELFEGFRQEDASTRRRHQGLGLGLTIVRSLTELHGGSVAAFSDGPGCGALFVVRLPIDGGTATSMRADDAPAAPVDLRGVSVLFVDDDADTRTVVSRLLEDAGATVHTAAGADEALARLATDPPDVLVSDIGMPERDGHQLIEAVRRLPDARVAGVPAAALTAFARPADRRRALQAGFDRHATKPIDTRELLGVVAGLAARGARSERGAR